MKAACTAAPGSIATVGALRSHGTHWTKLLGKGTVGESMHVGDSILDYPVLIH